MELEGTQIGDASAHQLKRLRKLEVLRVKDTLLTDRGVIELAHLSNLSELSSGGQTTTAAGSDEKERILESRLPMKASGPEAPRIPERPH